MSTRRGSLERPSRASGMWLCAHGVCEMRQSSSRRTSAIQRVWCARRVWLSVAFIFLIARVAQGATVSLAWDPNPEPDIAGYVLSYGIASGQYLGTIDVGNVTTFVFTKP